MIILSIPSLPKMPNQLLRRHWTTVMKEKKSWHEKVLIHLVRLNICPEEPFKHVRLVLTRKSTKQPDYDGLVGSFKYVIDGLIKAGVITGDDPSVISEAKYLWEKCKRVDQGIVVEIYPEDSLKGDMNV